MAFVFVAKNEADRGAWFVEAIVEQGAPGNSLNGGEGSQEVVGRSGALT